MRKRISVTEESESGRNLAFVDNVSGFEMSRKQFVEAIRKGEYDDYHVRVIIGIPTPCSNPDEYKGNNLG